MPDKRGKKGAAIRVTRSTQYANLEKKHQETTKRLEITKEIATEILHEKARQEAAHDLQTKEKDAEITALRKQVQVLQDSRQQLLRDYAQIKEQSNSLYNDSADLKAEQELRQRAETSLAKERQRVAELEQLVEERSQALKQAKTDLGLLGMEHKQATDLLQEYLNTMEALTETVKGYGIPKDILETYRNVKESGLPSWLYLPEFAYMRRRIEANVDLLDTLFEEKKSERA